MLITVAIFIIFLLILGIYLYKAYRTSTTQNIYNTLTTLMTFIASIILTRLAINLFSANVTTKLSSLLKNVLKITQEEWPKSASLDNLANFLATILIGLSSFLLIYSLLSPINHFIKRWLFKKIHKTSFKEYQSSKDIKILNIILGVISFYLISLVYLYPYAALADIVDTSLTKADYPIPASLDAVVDNPILKVYNHLGSEQLFDTITQVQDQDQIATSTELKGLLTRDC